MRVKPFAILAAMLAALAGTAVQMAPTSALAADAPAQLLAGRAFFGAHNCRATGSIKRRSTLHAAAFSL